LNIPIWTSRRKHWQYIVYNKMLLPFP